MHGLNHPTIRPIFAKARQREAQRCAAALNGAQDIDELQLALDRARYQGFAVTINDNGQYEVTE